ncbi:MAG: YhbY family RNA-binding protein [Myxococcaceae bacterium]
MELKARAHSLKPIVMVGKNGITESLLVEIDAALKAHELIKIKFLEAALEIMEQDTAIWLSKLRAELIETKGHVMTLYRKNPPKKKKA